MLQAHNVRPLRDDNHEHHDETLATSRGHQIGQRSQREAHACDAGLHMEVRARLRRLNSGAVACGVPENAA